MTDPGGFYYSKADSDRLMRERQRRQQEFDAMLASINEGVAQRVLSATQRYPSAPPGVVTANAVGALPDEMMEEAVLRSAESDGNWFTNAIGAVGSGIGKAWEQVNEYGIKPTVRTLFTAVDTIAQETVQRPLTAALAAAGGQATSFGEAYNAYGNSAGVEALQSLFEGGGTENLLGTGFFAGGRAGAESEAQRTLQIDGQKATLGRAFTANTVGQFVDPGTTAYNTTAFLSQLVFDIGLDPTVYATGGLSKAPIVGKAIRQGANIEQAGRGKTFLIEGAQGLRQAKRQVNKTEQALFQQVRDGKSLAEAAGAIESPYRRTLLLEKARRLTEDDALLDAVAGMDAADIAKVVFKDSRLRLSDDQIYQMAKATDRETVRNVLFDFTAGGQIRDMRTLKGMGNFQRESWIDSHLFGNAGERLRKFTGLSAAGRMSQFDLLGTALRADSLMKQTNVAPEVRRARLNQLFDILGEDDPSRSFQNVFNNIASDIAATSFLDETAEEIAGTIIQNLDAAQQQTANVARSYLRDMVEGKEIATGVSRTMQIDGEEVVVPTAQFLNQLRDMDHYIDFNRVQELRRGAVQTRALRAIYQSRGWRGSEKAARLITLNAFKPLVLLRPAFAAREFFDGQMRLTGANVDYDTVFSSPLRYFAGVRASKKDLKQFMGEDIEDMAYRWNVLSQDLHGLLKPTAAQRTVDMVPVTKVVRGEKGREQAVNAWRWNIQHYASDESIRALARHRFDTETWVNEWAKSTEGRAYFQKLSTASENHRVYANLDSPAGEEALRKLADGAREMLVGADGAGGLLAGLDSKAFEVFVNGGARLGKQKKSLFKYGDRRHINRILDDLDEAEGLMPTRLMMPSRIAADGAARKNERSLLEFLASKFMTEPANNWTRYPALRQRLIKNTTEMLDDIDDPAMRARIVENLEADFNLTRFEKNDLKKALERADGKNHYAVSLDPETGFEDFTQMVRSRSMSEALDDLFDIADRSAIQESFGAVAPFYDAYVEALQTYGRIAKDNPAFFVKGMQGYQSMREQGFFFVDDNNEERFTMPGGGALTAFIKRWSEAGGEKRDIPLAMGGALIDTLTGNEENTQAGGFGVNLEGRVQGLNIVLQGVGPGFGPMVQWAAGAFLPKGEDFDMIREFVNPFGSEFNQASDLADPRNALMALLPAHAQKWLNALTDGNIDPVQHNTAIGDAMGVLAETGLYDPADPNSRNKLVDDARRAGNFLMLVRGVAQAIAPTGPAATWRFQPAPAPGMPKEWDPEIDPDGRGITLRVLGDEYRRLGNEYGYDAAGKMFFEMYGVEPWYITQSTTRADSPLPTTREGARWVDAHSNAARKYPSVIGYFAPEGAEDEFDYSIYKQQILDGQRDLLSLDQQAALATQTRARQMYYNYKKQVEDAGIKGKAKTVILRSVKSELETQFPGWTVGVAGVNDPPKIEERIKDLTRAAFDPELDDSPVTPGLRIYLQQREQAVAIARQRDPSASGLGKVRDADLLQALNEIGTKLAVEDENFRGVWQSLLSREMEQ